MARGAAAPDHDDEKEHEFWRAFVSQRRDLWTRAGLDDILEGMPRMEFMLRFVLGHPDLHTTIVGTTSGEVLVKLRPIMPWSAAIMA